MQIFQSTTVEFIPHSASEHCLTFEQGQWLVTSRDLPVACFMAFQTAVRFLILETEIPFDRWSVVINDEPTAVKPD